MKKDVIIVGGGIIGLSIAYNLLKKKPGLKVSVLEKRYVGCGSSTRNSSHNRVHFWSEENVRFSIKSWILLKNLSKELKWNPIFYQGGYLWLIFDEKDLKIFEDVNSRIWSRYNVSVSFLDKNEVKKKYPYLNTNELYAGVFGPQDGKFHHDFVTYGYYYNLKKMGGEVSEYTPVKDIIIKNGKVYGVKVFDKIVESENVIIAAGDRTKQFFNRLGIELPLKPSRKENCVLEPTKFFIEPLIIDMRPSSQGLYICQTIRGEIMGSIDYPNIIGDYEYNNTFEHLNIFTRNAINLIPVMRYLSFLRIWSGSYNMSPDHSHILGRDEKWPEGLYIATGYSGHGFMLAPYTGVVMADYIIDGIISRDLRPYLPTRFKENKPIHETMVIG